MSLTTFFQPKSIAVIGASRDRGKIGNRVLTNIAAGFRGVLLPVNPHASKVEGFAAFPDVAQLPVAADLAVVVTPAAAVPAVVDGCGKRGIKNVVVISAGFGETGERGKALESEVRTAVQRYRLRLLGPNCLGFTHGALNASFGPAIARPGGAVLLSQSGAMAVAMAEWAAGSGVGFRAMVSMGNKAGLDERRLLEHFGADKATTTLLLYLESVANGEALLRVGRKITKKKPVVALLAGQSALGRRAAVTHTGALASDAAVLRAALESCGILTVTRLEDLYDHAMAFSSGKRMRGNRIAVVTNAGGAGVLASDAVAKTSLTLAPFNAATRTALDRSLPPAAGKENPIDVLGDADVRRYASATSAALKDPNVDGVCVFATHQVVTDAAAIARVLAQAHRASAKPVFVSLFGGKAMGPSLDVLRDAGVPNFSFPEDAIDAMDAVWRRDRLSTGRPSTVSAVRTRSRVRLPRVDLLLPPRVTQVLKAYGFRTERERVGRNAHEVAAASRSLRFPVALKFISRHAVHKTVSGAIWLNLRSEREVRAACVRAGRAVPAAWRRDPDARWLVQPMAHGKNEWFLGAKRDPSFGPVVLFGVGGVHVEQLQRMVMLFPPFDARSIERELRASPLAAWKPPFRTAAAACARMGQLINSEPRVQSCDINPLVETAAGELLVLDARMTLS